MTPAAMLALLQQWRTAGWLRPLDLAFAGFVHQLDPDVPGSLLLAAALVAQLEGQGHSCLPIDRLTTDPADLLAWPADATQSLIEALTNCWPTDRAAAQAAWGGRHVLQFEPLDEAGSSPMVLSGSRLYLRRYWRYEARIATQVLGRTSAGSGEAVEEMSPARRERARGLLDRLFPAPTPAPAAAALEMAPDGPPAPDWQKIACALALRSRMTLVTGGPGTGKTYTAARLLVLLQALHDGPQPLRVALAAPTGKAAARLRQSIEVALHGLREQSGGSFERDLDPWSTQLPPARTLHALLGARLGTRRFLHDAAHPLDLDLLFVDEASMVHLEMMAALLEALPSGARLVLLGDKDQLASVEAGAVMGDLCRPPPGAEAAAGAGAGAGTPVGAPLPGYRPETVQWLTALTGQLLPASNTDVGSRLAQQTVVLQRSRRFAGPIEALALAVNRGDGRSALALMHTATGDALALIEVHDTAAIPSLAVAGRPGAPGGYRAYLQLLASRPSDVGAFEGWAQSVLVEFDRFRVLCAVREGPWGVVELNPAIERALAQRGLLQRHAEWYEGRPVMVTRNDASLGVFNGDIGMVLRPPGQSSALRAYFADGSAVRSVAVGRLADVDTAFTMTVHKSQGSEFEHVALVLPREDTRVVTRELVYTGITRARRAFTLAASDPGQLVSASARATRRTGGLAALLDSLDSGLTDQPS